MPLVDPNPTTNPALLLQCANCKGQGRVTTWTWHIPAGVDGGMATELGERTAKDPTQPEEINVMYPHCPYCGSSAVDVLRVTEPTTLGA